MLGDLLEILLHWMSWPTDRAKPQGAARRRIGAIVGGLSALVVTLGFCAVVGGAFISGREFAHAAFAITIVCLLAIVVIGLLAALIARGLDRTRA